MSCAILIGVPPIPSIHALSYLSIDTPYSVHCSRYPFRVSCPLTHRGQLTWRWILFKAGLRQSTGKQDIKREKKVSEDLGSCHRRRLMSDSQSHSSARVNRLTVHHLAASNILSLFLDVDLPSPSPLGR